MSTNDLKAGRDDPAKLEDEDANDEVRLRGCAVLYSLPCGVHIRRFHLSNMILSHDTI